MNRTARVFTTAALVAGGLGHASLASSADPLPSTAPAAASQPDTQQILDPKIEVTTSATGEKLFSMTCKNTPVRAALVELFKASGQRGTMNGMGGPVHSKVTMIVKTADFYTMLLALLRNGDQWLTYQYNDGVFNITPPTHQVTDAELLAKDPTKPADAPYAPATPYLANARYYRVQIVNIKATALMDKLDGSEDHTAGYIPAGASVEILPTVNDLIFLGTPDDFGKLVTKIKAFDVPGGPDALKVPNDQQAYLVTVHNAKASVVLDDLNSTHSIPSQDTVAVYGDNSLLIHASPKEIDMLISKVRGFDVKRVVNTPGITPG